MSRTPVLQIVESSDQSSPYEPNFEDFYLLYPRHVARKDAQRAWARLSTVERVAALVGLVQWRRVWDYEASRRDDFYEFMPYPATWINGARWEDELPRAFRTPPSPDTGASARSSLSSEAEGPRQPIPQFVLDAITKLRSKR